MLGLGTRIPEHSLFEIENRQDFLGAGAYAIVLGLMNPADVPVAIRENQGRDRNVAGGGIQAAVADLQQIDHLSLRVREQRIFDAEAMPP